MKLKSVIFACALSLCSSVFAVNNQHIHPKASTIDSPSIVERAGNCEIEIVNRSYSNVHVNGVFDDGSSLRPFNVYSFESPHYISLYYYGYCHAGMDLYIDTFEGDNLYSGFIRRQTTITIVPYLNNQVRVEAQAK